MSISFRISRQIPRNRSAKESASEGQGWKVREGLIRESYAALKAFSYLEAFMTLIKVKMN